MDFPQRPDVSDQGSPRKQVRDSEPARRRRRERGENPQPKPSSGPVLVHTIRLSESVTAELALPDKLSVADAERIASVVLALAAGDD